MVAELLVHIRETLVVEVVEYVLGGVEERRLEERQERSLQEMPWVRFVATDYCREHTGNG